jgi:transposase
MDIKRCKISKYKQRKLLEFFVGETTARTASELVSVHRNSAILFYHKIRMVIAFNLDQQVVLKGKVEADESYFGGVRKGKRGRGAAGKVPVFGLLQRNGKVYTQMIADAKSNTLLPIIQAV